MYQQYHYIFAFFKKNKTKRKHITEYKARVENVLFRLCVCTLVPLLSLTLDKLLGLWVILWGKAAYWLTCVIERDLRVEGVKDKEEEEEGSISFSEGGEGFGKNTLWQGSLLHYNNRKLRPLAKTCCATGGVIVYTEGSGKEKGATGMKGGGEKQLVSGNDSECYVVFIVPFTFKWSIPNFFCRWWNSFTHDFPSSETSTLPQRVPFIDVTKSRVTVI